MYRRRPAPVVSRGLALVFGLVLAAAVAPLVVPLLPLKGRLQEGDLAPRTLEARHDAQYPSEALTETARQQAAATIQEIYLPPDPAIRHQQLEKLARLMEQVRSIRLQANLNSQQQLVEVANLPGAAQLSAAGRSNLVTLDRSALDGFSQRAALALGDLLEKGIQPGEPARRIDEYMAATSATPPTLQDNTLAEILEAFVVPNMQVDAAATEKAREDARANVSPVIQTYSHGQVIVAEGQVLDAEKIEALRATGVIRDSLDLYEVAAGGLFALAFGLLFAAYLVQFQPFPAPPGRRLILTGVTIVAALIAVRFILPEVTPDRSQHYLAFALPVATVAMIVASFSDLQFAAVAAVLVGGFAAFAGITSPDLAGASFVGPIEAFELATAYVVGGLVGAISVYRAERLTRYAVSALAVAGGTWVVMVVFWLLSETRSNEALGWLTLAAGLNGAGAAVVTTGVFVVLSMALGVTTRLQLMELAQSDHPLLVRLQEEAPGTYHHSMMVGTLAERAATRVGADALVVRVGAYYHDLGKLAQPGYYIENMLDGAPSPHDSLTPAESARLIRDHVANGVDIARRHRLPPLIRDFIPEHHGTRLVTYFYRRAAQGNRGSVDPAEFRYGGPRPQTKETAIVMLADSCEAVVRASDARAQAHIDELVDGVIAERLAEGQLDECDITMRDLQQVAASFKASLRAVYHPRIDYPTPNAEEFAISARLAEDDAVGPAPTSAETA